MQGAHVLQLIDGLNIGGAEMLLRELSFGLIQRGFRVSVAYSTPGPLVKELKALGISLTRLPRLMRVDPILFAGMYFLMRRDPPQIVHTHLFKSDFHGRPAARLAGVPVVVSTLHSVDRWAQNWLFGSIYGFTARLADRIIAVSEDSKNFHIKNTRVDQARFVTIENGVDIDRYAPSDFARQAIRREFGLDDHAIVFGIIGRLTAPKDHQTFLLAAKSILAQIPNARFLVVGDGSLRAELQSKAEHFGFQTHMIFTGFRKDIPEILSALDVLVISSIWEGLPVNLLEGMAARKPIVATAVGGIPDVVTTETAFLVPPSNPDAIAEACIRLAIDPSLRQNMGRAGFERALAHYSMDVMVDRTASLYVHLLKAHGLHRFIPVTLAAQESQ